MWFSWLKLYIILQDLIFVKKDESKEQQLAMDKVLKQVDLELILELQKKEREERELTLKQQRALLKQKGIILDETETFG